VAGETATAPVVDRGEAGGVVMKRTLLMLEKQPAEHQHKKQNSSSSNKSGLKIAGSSHHAPSHALASEQGGDFNKTGPVMKRTLLMLEKQKTSLSGDDVKYSDSSVIHGEETFPMSLEEGELYESPNASSTSCLISKRKLN
jgi:hypothetical protein